MRLVFNLITASGRRERPTLITTAIIKNYVTS